MPLIRELELMAAEMRQWRHQLHAHPETAYEERRTADFVARLLAEWGIEVHRGLAVTGVVGTLSAGRGGRSIGLRADMDALNLQESNVFPHRSCIEGKMHACGHDGHMAMLLGAAKYLASTRRFDGTVRFIFQPAEENEAGGRRMVQEGLFRRFPVDAVYGMHNMPFIAEGRFAIRSGPVMASSDYFEILVRGKGSHGAWPHTGTDVIGIASEIVLALNHIVARSVNPLESAVISVTQFNAGHSSNVMPELARVIGTARAFSSTVQDDLESRMRQACSGIAAAYGATADVVYERRYPPTVNPVRETEVATAAAARVIGADQVLLDEPPVMAAEDFAWMLLEKPGCYVWIGNGAQHQGGRVLHNPGYDFNDRILPIGASYWVELTEGWLAESVGEVRRGDDAGACS